MRRKEKEKQQKIKDMLLVHKQIPLPSYCDKETTIQHGISEIIAVLYILFSTLEECMLLIMVLFSFVLASIIFKQRSWAFLGYTSSNAGQFTTSTIAYYF